MSPANKSTILITGATGNIGSALTQLLSDRGTPFRAMVRDEAQAGKLAQLPGAQTVIADFNDAQSLTNALQGIKKAFLLTNSSELAETQQTRFVELAAAAGVQHIVKLSQWAADANSPVRFLRYHAAVEKKIKASGMTYTFLRPNLFMQGLLGLREYIIHKGVFFASVGDASISAVDIRDIAEVAVNSLTRAGHENRIYNLTGPQSLTHYQLAEILSAAVNRTIHFVDTSADVMQDALLKAGFPEWQAAGLIEDYVHYSKNEAAQITNDIEQVTGHTPRSFEQFAKDYAPLFS